MVMRLPQQIDIISHPIALTGIALAQLMLIVSKVAVSFVASAILSKNTAHLRAKQIRSGNQFVN